MIETLAPLFWKQFWQITLLIPAVVLLVRYCLPRFPDLGYGLLLLVLVKTIFPPIWEAPTGFVWELIPYHDQTVLEEGNSAVSIDFVPEISPEPSKRTTFAPRQKSLSQAPQPQSHPVATSSPFPLPVLLISIWLTGALGLVGYVLGKRVQLLKFHRDMQVPIPDDVLDVMATVSAELGMVRMPNVMLTQHPTVPFASGYFYRVVVLPAHLVEQTDLSDLKLIVAHEMTHLRRGDTLVGLLQLLVQVVWWFHPLVYWLNREVRRLREECCDTDVVTHLKCHPASYARCLLNMLELQKRLRPSAELIGLSPFDVNAKRMKNIMRQRTADNRSWSRAGLIFTMIIFALLILPANGRSLGTPKVIVGELAPANAFQVEAIPTPTDQQPDPDLARQHEPAELEVEAAPQESPPVSIAKQEPQQPVEIPAIREPLRYQWARGHQHAYHVKIVARYPTEIRTHEGSPTFRVQTVVAGTPTFAIDNTQFSQQVEVREGVTIPTLPQLEEDDFSTPFSSFPGSRLPEPFHPGLTRRPPALTSRSNGDIAPAEGELPYLLGQIKDWVFPTLAADGQSHWREEFMREFVIVSHQGGGLNPFQSPSQEHLRTNVRAESTLQSVSQHQVRFSRSWALATQQQANGEPRREMTLTGEVELDPQTNFPRHASYSGKLIEREPNREYRIPMTIEIHRVQ